VIAMGAAVAMVMEQVVALRSAPAARAMIGACTLLVSLGLVRSAMRQRVWRDETALTLAAVQDSPKSWRAQWNYGELLFERGDTTGGFAAYREAIALAPRAAFARNALARRLRDIGDDRRALEQLSLSLREIPGQVEATSELVTTLIALGRYAEAKSLADRVIAFENSPPLMVALSRLADSARTAGAPPGAIRIRLGR
jgi:tetratricopeptide (TPR) repeat protein